MGCRIRRLVTLALVIPATVLAEDLQEGVVIEMVASGHSFDRAGLQPGDVLLEWRRQPRPPQQPHGASGRFDSPSAVTLMSREQALRGGVTVLGRRDGELFSVALEALPLGVKVRPAFDAITLTSYQRGKQLNQEGNLDGAITVWRETAARLSSQGRYLESSFLLALIAEQFVLGKRPEEAGVAMTEAKTEIRRSGDPVGEIRFLCKDAFVKFGRADIAGAESAVKEALAVLREAGLGGGLYEAYLLALLTETIAYQGQMERALLVAEQALAIAQREGPDSWLRAEILSTMGNTLSASDLERSEQFLRQAVALHNEVAPGSYWHAVALQSLAEMQAERGRLAEAITQLERALEMFEALSKINNIASVLNRLGEIASRRGDLTAAAAYLRRAREHLEESPGRELDVANAEQNLARVLEELGDLAGAEELYRSALAFKRKTAPSTLETADARRSLASVLLRRGDPAAAEQLLHQALAISEQQVPDTLSVAEILGSLGRVAVARGDLDAAASYLQRALSIEEQQAPDSLRLAETCHHLGDVELRRGYLEDARRLHDRALSLRNRLAPDSVRVAQSLSRRAAIAAGCGDLEAAGKDYDRALQLFATEAPFGADALQTRIDAGIAALQSGDRERAAELARQSVDLAGRLHPGTLAQANAHRLAGQVARSAGELQRAAGSYHQALETIEQLRGRLGGSEQGQAGFTAGHLDHVLEQIDLLLELDRGREAFAVLERSRARSLLAMLATRDLELSGDVPAELDRRRRRLDAEFVRRQEQLTDLGPEADEETIGRLVREITELNDRRTAVAAEIRSHSPRTASLRYAEPLDVNGVLQALDPGTVLLSYAVAPQVTYLFVISAVPDDPQPFAAYQLPVEEQLLTSSVKRFRLHLASGASSDAALSLVREHGRDLYQRLLVPARKNIAAADRLLICADGPLWLLPFAALVTPAAQGREQYLAEWKPLHTAASATLYAELRKQPRSDRDPQDSAPTVVAFGDPRYPIPDTQQEQIADSQLRSLLDRSRPLTPLPASRREVEGIGKVWGDDHTRLYLGADASEEHARDIGKDARIIHFACHGRMDQRFPLSSALILTIPEEAGEGGGNGLLQAWEVFESMRIDADLVVLSACDTGLGENVRGEGLIGLSRAFQYAGARSVVASLWAVEDESTAVLMTRLHQGLRDGLSTDQALRQAQLSLAAGPVEVRQAGGGTRTIDATHPFAWAGFTLIGDWR